MLVNNGCLPLVSVNILPVAQRDDQRLLHVECSQGGDTVSQRGKESLIRVRIHSDGDESVVEIPLLITDTRP